MPSLEPPEAEGLALLEQLDGYAPLRNGLRRLSGQIEEWAGVPIPVEEHRLVVEPKYPFVTIADIGQPENEPDEEMDQWQHVNQFYSNKRRCDIAIFRHKTDGRVAWTMMKPAFHHLQHDLGALSVSDVWGIEQESRAVLKLAELIRHRQFKQYMLTGMFSERSKRSDLHYVFRRLRPTIVLTTHKGPSAQILCALCMHPIAYYHGTWAGAMCPTDDVIAHLVMMRGDEKMFWRRANQHPAHRPEAGL